MHPGAAALRFAQDKQAMRERLGALGVPVPAMGAGRATPPTLAAFGAEDGWPVVLKAATGGYDGKGVWVVGPTPRRADVLGSRHPADRRGAGADRAASWPRWSPARRSGRARPGRSSRPCSATASASRCIAPAPGSRPTTAPTTAQALALRIAAELDVVGVLAVELFETADGAASSTSWRCARTTPAHWTIEGARTSQFEQHLRAVLDYPLGATTPTAPVVVMANLLGGPDDVVPKGIDERVHHFMAAGRTSRSTCTASSSGPAARSGT